MGLGVESSEYLVTTDSVPIFASTPFNTSIVEPKKIELMWPSVTNFAQTGGDPVISYQLEFDISVEDEDPENWIVINDPLT